MHRDVPSLRRAPIGSDARWRVWRRGHKLRVRRVFAISPAPVDITFHYPADLLQLLTDTIPRLCRAKRDVLLFFQGAGVPAPLTADVAARFKANPSAIGKREMVSVVLTRINERGDATLRERREVLRRVVEFESFASCWENDRLPAKGLVAEIRALVEAKDTVTKIRQGREADRAVAVSAKRAELERVAARRAAGEAVRRDLGALFAETDPHRRGKALEAVLNRLFALDGLSVREAFTLRDPGGQGVFEQVDGVIALDGHLYLVEMKWWTETLGPGDVAQHQVRVYNRGQARGLFIASAGFTPAAVQACREQLHHAPFVLAELREFVDLLEHGWDAAAMLRAKVEAAILDRRPLHIYQPPPPRAPA